ncbi:DUF6894 family protein [Sphingomonas sp. PB4P5]|uniref:DUF6894 family protein n=1 Tax=Parasphingomonas puruogangriensis TaxID=3096155 RepID=UPI003FA7AFA1
MLFRFNLCEPGEDDLFDDEGVDLPTLGAARTMALVAARDILAGEVRDGDPVCLRRTIVIIDKTGTIVLTVPFAHAITLTSASAFNVT